MAWDLAVPFPRISIQSLKLHLKKKNTSNLSPLKINECPPKRDSLKKKSSSNHWFWGDILLVRRYPYFSTLISQVNPWFTVFRGVLWRIVQWSSLVHFKGSWGQMGNLHNLAGLKWTNKKYFPLNPGCFMTGSLYNRLWNNPHITG